jgi:transposase
VAAKHAEVTAYVDAHREELESGERVLLFVDECFLHWGDVCGYGWGKRNERLTLDVVNTQARQAFYGALDAATGEMHLMPYPVAQSDNTADFLVELQSRYPNAKLTVCWDNARWHKGADLVAFLERENGGHQPEDWPITCINFAPHDPTQNPIEEVWHQGKTAVQQLRLVAQKFQQVVDAFEQFLERTFFDFPNRQRYGNLHMV